MVLLYIRRLKIDKNIYETGIKATDKSMKDIDIGYINSHYEWSYIIKRVQTLIVNFSTIPKVPIIISNHPILLSPQRQIPKSRKRHEPLCALDKNCR